MSLKGHILFLFNYANKIKPLVKTLTSVVYSFGSAFTQKVHSVYISNRSNATMTHFAIRIVSVSVAELKNLASFSCKKKKRKKSLLKTALLFSVQMLTLLNWKHSPPSSPSVGIILAYFINDLFYTHNQTIRCIKIL